MEETLTSSTNRYRRMLVENLAAWYGPVDQRNTERKNGNDG